MADAYAAVLADMCDPPPPPPETRPEWATPGELAKAVDSTTVQTPALDLIDEAIAWAYSTPGARLAVSMPPQEGKGLALETPIATPSGWAAMGDLRVGGTVFGGDGKPCRVTAAYAPRVLDCWRVTFANGSEIVADGDHLWSVQDRNGDVRGSRASGQRARPWVVVNTRALAAKPVRYGVALPGALELPASPGLPLDPYLLGAWLGDGDTDSAGFTCNDPEIIEQIRAAGYIVTRGSGPYSWYVTLPQAERRCLLEGVGPERRSRPGQGPIDARGLCSRHYAIELRRGRAELWPLPETVRGLLRKLGVLGGKRVPVSYLRSGNEQRLALLQGLMDTDGSVYANESGYTRCEFTTTCERLGEDVLTLTRSLGIHSKVHESRATLNGRDISARWRIRFTTTLPVFRLARKAARLDGSPGERKARYRNGIASVEPVTSVPTRCIEVDSPDRTFLAGHGLIPTHNSSRVTKTGSLWALTRDPELRIGIVSYAQSLADGFGRDIRNTVVTNDGTDGTLNIGLRIAADYGSARRWQLDGHRGGVVAAGVGSGLTGRPLDAICVDDPFADAVQAGSAYYRDRVWDWWQSVGSTRLAPDAPVLVICTRWHEDDFVGRLLAAEDGSRWRVINIPAQADHDPEKGQADPLGREPGEWLQSARGRTAVQWEQIKIQSGSRAFAALYQGRPSPDQGNVWQRQWWRRYREPLWSQHPDIPGAYLVDCDEMLLSFDMSFKGTSGSDYVAGQCWARRGASAYLLDQVHKRLGFTDTLTAFAALAARWPQASRKIVELAANGEAVLDSFKGKIPGIVGVKPRESKYARASAVSPFIEAGNALLPESALALFDVEAFIDEAAGFPNAAHDDQIDSASQALAEMFLDGTGAQAWIAWAKRKAEAAAREAAGEAPEPKAAVVEEPKPAAEPEPGAPAVALDPAAALRAARTAMFRQQSR